MLYHRILEHELKQSVRQYPVVVLIGPRQSGKTTLVKSAFPDKPYASLESPDIRLFAQMDPRGFLEQYKNGAILDEIQRLPQLLSYIQEMVDQSEQKGLFILTGSHQIALHEAISQSLAGRSALLTLLPLSMVELSSAGIDFSVDEYLLTGFFPRIYKDHLDPTKAYHNYMQTALERDIRQIINLKDLLLFQKFLRLCAGRIGQPLNMHSLSNEVGVSSHTINHWVAVLEASFLIIRLPPFFNNVGKRNIKSPKLYFTDVGLATYLLDIENTIQLSRDPLRGQLMENLVVMELYKRYLNQGKEAHLYFYRDSNQNEVDVIIKRGDELIPIEIKSAKTFNSEFLKGLKYFSKLEPLRVKKGIVVYAGELEQQIDRFFVMNYKHLNQI